MATKSPAATSTKKKRSTRAKSTTPTKAAPKKAQARRATPKPASAPRSPSRAIFVDVENTSSEADLLKVLDHLKIDRKLQPTQLFALGNWKSVGTRVARMLASHGAQLMHSAPAVGVRDWSDLWIAVAAGRWLATAAPGDVLDIVSDDRAFDAVADAAAATGVDFRRTSYRALPGSAQPSVAAQPRARRGRRGGRGRRRGSVSPSPAPALHAPRATPPAPALAEGAAPLSAPAEEEAHAASHEQVRAALTRLTGGTPRWINLDSLANALKTEGFVRPPGSPRLVTRLRKMKDVEVSPNGMVRLNTETPEEAPPAEAPVRAPRRPRRRGGRGRRRSGLPTAHAAAPPVDASAH